MSKPEDAHSKGGGQRGGPKRWSGGGPLPARHIPWPEIFKHHESVLTGHLKMVDMVRKHTAEGTGNYNTVMAIVDRTHKMIGDFREVKRSFVPPRDQLNKVPLGTSSASMYPGYSPADHIYGEAANEYGKAVAEAKRLGLPIPADPNGPQYVEGQSIVSKKQALANANANANSSQALSGSSTAELTKSPRQNAEQKAGDETNGDVPLFVIDSNPTPVNLQQAEDEKTKKSEKKKRRTSTTKDGEPRKKKAKTVASEPEADPEEMDGVEPTTAPAAPVVDTEDISADVDARLKAKEEKRKRKEGKAEKKRKRSQEDSSMVVGEVEDAPAVAVESSKPSKKKVKTDEAAQGEKAVKKSKKDKKRHMGEEEAESEVIANGEGKKKSKKHKDKS